MPAIEGMPGANNIRAETIAGADHFFRDLAVDQLADRINDFLQPR
jgi:alpha/beta superfamily hydrolase